MQLQDKEDNVLTTITHTTYNYALVLFFCHAAVRVRGLTAVHQNYKTEHLTSHMPVTGLPTPVESQQRGNKSGAGFFFVSAKKKITILKLNQMNASPIW